MRKIGPTGLETFSESNAVRDEYGAAYSRRFSSLISIISLALFNLWALPSHALTVEPPSCENIVERTWSQSVSQLDGVVGGENDFVTFFRTQQNPTGLRTMVLLDCASGIGFSAPNGNDTKWIYNSEGVAITSVNAWLGIYALSRSERRVTFEELVGVLRELGYQIDGLFDEDDCACDPETFNGWSP